MCVELAAVTHNGAQAFQEKSLYQQASAVCLL